MIRRKTMNKNKQLTLRLSLSTTFTVIVLVTSVLLGVATYSSVRNYIHISIRQRLMDMVGIAALQINGIAHSELVNQDDESSDTYIMMKAQLNAIKNVNKDIRFVYTFRFNSVNSVEFVVDASDNPEEMSHIGDVYDEAPEEMIRSLTNPPLINVDKRMYIDEWGTWLSSYAPFFDKSGKIAGAVGMDISGQKIREYEMRYLSLLIVISVFISIFVLIVGNIFARRISKPLSVLSDDLLRIQKLDFDHVAEIHSNIKEVVEIMESVDNMKKGLRSFRKYVPADVVAELISLHKEAVLGAERKELTILFSDIENFTSISEELMPEILAEELGHYFDGMTRVIYDHKGTVDKYIGDAIMAFWGAPSFVENHPAEACLSALQCQTFNKLLNEKFVKNKIPVMNTRIGIHTGDAIVGNMGYEKRLTYTAIGDSVNLASRLEGLNKYYGTKILISDSTYNVVYKEFEVRLIDIVAVKGKKTGIKIYELLGTLHNFGDRDPDYIKSYREGMQYYLNRDWINTASIFQKLIAMDPFDKPAAMMYERVSKFLTSPPPDNWTGIIMLRDK
ncbi:MAG TPA: hypothetical protein DDY71_10230 [Spirochaetia bacterium]|nr:hypothetical protein [Spirochaetia bacterium]